MQRNNDKVLTSKFRRLEFFKNDPTAQAIATKFVEPANGHSARHNSGAAAVIPEGASLERISKMLAGNIDDAANMMQINPDLGLAKEIMVSLIIAPKDLLSHELSWLLGKCELPTDLAGAMLDLLHTYFTQDYKIDDLLVPACEQALFETGSYPLVIIPESSVDNIINQNGRIALEDLQDGPVFKNGHTHNRAILGNGQVVVRPTEENKVAYVADVDPSSRSWGLESLAGLGAVEINDRPWFDNHVSILDSADNLKIPMLRERVSQEMLKDRMVYGNVSMESIQRDVELERLENALYVRRSTQHVPVVTVDVTGNASRLPKGHPLVMKMPSESIIPVHIPGSPKDHVGYFVMIDEFGNPVTRASSSDYYKQLTSNMRSPMDNYNSQASTILSNVKTFMGPNCEANKFDGQQLLKAYSGMMETEIMTRLKRGIYGESVELSDMAEQIYSVMLARSLANMRTSLLYIPVEQVTYIAFDYNNAGLGKSLLDDVKILGALRSLLLFSDTMASIKNSVPRRSVDVVLDETLPDPFKTVELIQHEVAKSMNSAFPLGVTDPKEQIDMLQKAGVTWNISGHPNYPTTSVAIVEGQTNQVRIDNELSDTIKNMQYMGLGMPPEIVDSSLNIEFAATVYSSNLLLAKRSAQKQAILTGFMEDFVRKYVSSDGTLLEGLRELIDLHKDKLAQYAEEGEQLRYSKVINTFLDALQLDLPSPDQMKIETQLASLQNYLAILDAALPLALNDDILRESMGEKYAQYSTAVYNAYRNDMALDWMVKNNILPEIQKLFRVNLEDNNPGYDFLTARLDHVNALSVTVAKYVERLAEKNGGESEGGAGGTTDAGGFGTDTGDGFGEPSFDGSDTGASQENPAEDDFGLEQPEQESDTTAQDQDAETTFSL